MINSCTGEVKLIDFGACMPFVQGELVDRFCGTPHFAAPEVLFQDYHRGWHQRSAQEVWSLGALLFVILFNTIPFEDDDAILNMCINDKIDNLANHVTISDDTIKLLNKMLEKNPSKRLDITEIRTMRYLSG